MVEAPPLCLMIVEDDPDMQLYYRTTLRDMGVEMVAAYNGAEALAFLDAGKHVDLIVLDMVMPVMNGEEFFRHLRKARGLDIPVIFSSVDVTRAKPLLSIGPLQGIFLKGRPSKELKEMILGNLPHA